MTVTSRSEPAADSDFAEIIRTLLQARDHTAIVRTLAPDIVVGSPVTLVLFRGRRLVSRVLERLFIQSAAWAAEWHVEPVLHFGDTYVVSFGGRLGGQEFEMVNFLTVDDQFIIRKMIVYVRPLAGVGAVASFMFPGVARLRGRTRSYFVWLICRPLAPVLALGVRVMIRVGLSTEGTDIEPKIRERMGI